MNNRIEKLEGEIRKTKSQITKLQSRLKELEAKKTELENGEIVSLFRSVNVPLDELAGFIQAYKAQTPIEPNEEVEDEK